LTSAPDIVASQALRFRIWADQEGVPLNDMDSGLIADDHDQHAHHWGVHDGDELVGSARLCFHEDLASAPDGDLFAGSSFPPPLASLNRLVISRPYRGQGLASRLDLERLDLAKALGARTAIVTPLEGRRRIDALHRLGFALVTGRGAPIWSDSVPILAMYLPL